jgi:hypothetical protein
MNHKLWKSVGARVIAVTFVLAGVTACNRHDDVPAANAASPSTQVIGTPPAAATGDTPATTSVAADKKELTKSEESRSMPLEGQHNSFMTESQKDSQRAGKVDEQTQRRPQ